MKASDYTVHFPHQSNRESTVKDFKVSGPVSPDSVRYQYVCFHIMVMFYSCPLFYFVVTCIWLSLENDNYFIIDINNYLYFSLDGLMMVLETEPI